MNLAILFCLFWTVVGGGPLQAGGDRELLPPDGFLGKWSKAARSRLFTSADLYGHIDGGAELFLEFGFEQLTVQSFNAAPADAHEVSPGSEIRLEVYRMSDPVAAAGVYFLKCGKENPDSSFGDRHTVNNYQLIFERDRYFVVVNNTGGEERLRGDMLAFARHIASRLPAEKPMALTGTLPKEGLVAESIRLARGPYALQAIYTLGEGDILQLRRSIAAVAADYRGDSGKKTLILVDYPDAAAAAAAFRHVQGNLDRYLKIVAVNERGFLFEDFAGEYGKATRAGRRVTVEVHMAARPSLP